LAACAGLRAWLPLFVLGILARLGYADLNSSFSFLSRTDALIVFGVATVVEILGDKIITVDHFLDTIGTFLRPVTGTVLAASLLPSLGPLGATVIGLITGGGTALTVHAGKALTRMKVSSLLPVHGGVANTAVSIIEDIMVGGGMWLAMTHPWVAFALALAAIALALWFIVFLWRSGKRLFRFVFRPRPQAVERK
jgi:hypothetical protein